MTPSQCRANREAQKRPGQFLLARSFESARGRSFRPGEQHVYTPDHEKGRETVTEIFTDDAVLAARNDRLVAYSNANR